MKTGVIRASLESMYVTSDISDVEINVFGAAAHSLGAKIEILESGHGPFQSGLTLVCATYLRYLR